MVARSLKIILGMNVLYILLDGCARFARDIFIVGGGITNIIEENKIIFPVLI